MGMIRSEIKSLASQIQPLDTKEEETIAFVKDWINSGVEIFRIKKPDIPSPHVVSYFMPIDQKEKKLLLVDHKKANLWLPAGGHVELNEHPKDTASREMVEELGTQLEFLLEKPLFISMNETEENPHLDVSFWFILKAGIGTKFHFDEGEFRDIRWFSPEEIPVDKSDPHMQRFLKKLYNYHII